MKCEKYRYSTTEGACIEHRWHENRGAASAEGRVWKQGMVMVVPLLSKFVDF